jgi:hypothetical protein
VHKKYADAERSIGRLFWGLRIDGVAAYGNAAQACRWRPPVHERHSRNAVVFAFPIGFRNCDLAEWSSRVIARPRLN